VSFRRWHDPRSGIASWSASPRLSEGYTAIQNRPGLLIETHMLKNYQTRVTGTYEMLKHTMILLNRQHKLLRQVVQKADLYTASAGFRHKPFTVQFKTAKDSVMTEFLGVDYKKVKSDLTGGTWIKYGSKPVTYKIPFFNQQEPAVQVALPEAYIIPPEWTNIIARLQLHGVQLKQLVKPATISVNSYRFSHAQWQQRPFEGRHTLRFKSTEIEEVRTYPSGSVLIDMNQRAARVAVHILEPEAPDSYLHWGFFDTIFEQKEYAESYVMEELARRMLDEDENLKKEFEQKKTQDAEFAKNPRAILNWFYSQSPYWDKRINVYPVGKLFERAVLNSLEFRPGN
ncbi:MAG: peptidase M14, partial [bacterium]